jgi:hypothetical protein
MRHLESGHVDASDVQQIARELLHIMQAQDVGLALLDPRDTEPSRMTVWGNETDGRLFKAAYERLQPLRFMLEALRTSMQEACSLSNLRPELAKLAKSSFAHRELIAQTGFSEFAVIHMGRRLGEGLGRIGFFRANGGPEFDPERRRLLGRLQPAFSRAAAGIAERTARPSGAGIALLDSNATPIWISDSFRFLWNAVDDSRLSVGRRALYSLMAGGRFAARVGVHAVILREEMDVELPPEEFRIPCRGGRGELIARWMSVPGTLFSYPDRLLQVTLEPAEATPILRRSHRHALSSCPP